jgi:trehalose/maltose hydrolase-like predicted phosphorylase
MGHRSCQNTQCTNLREIVLTNKVSTPTKWAQITENMYIPFNKVLQIHEEYDGYNGHIINQADVVLLQYPVNWKMNRTIALNDVIYWQNKTDPNGYFTGDRYT